jgi:hypothetical protein
MLLVFFNAADWWNYDPEESMGKTTFLGSYSCGKPPTFFHFGIVAAAVLKLSCTYKVICC